MGGQNSTAERGNLRRGAPWGSAVPVASGRERTGTGRGRLPKEEPTEVTEHSSKAGVKGRKQAEEGYGEMRPRAEGVQKSCAGATCRDSQH